MQYYSKSNTLKQVITIPNADTGITTAQAMGRGYTVSNVSIPYYALSTITYTNTSDAFELVIYNKTGVFKIGRDLSGAFGSSFIPKNPDDQVIWDTSYGIVANFNANGTPGTYTIVDQNDIFSQATNIDRVPILAGNSINYGDTQQYYGKQTHFFKVPPGATLNITNFYATYNQIIQDKTTLQFKDTKMYFAVRNQSLHIFKT